jgi:hypothetical protein
MRLAQRAKRPRRWPSRESEESKNEDRAPLDRFGVWLFHHVFLSVAPSWWFIIYIGREDDRRNRVIGTIWVVFVTIGLLIMWQINPGDDITKDLFGALAALRWLEIFTVGLGIVLRQKESVIGHSLVTIAVLGAQVALIFAILDHSFATTDFAPPGGISAVTVPSRPFDFLYISWTQMVTLGNAYTPKTDAARALTMATSTSGVLLLAVFVASAIAHRGPNLGDGRAADGEGRTDGT